MNSSRPVKSDPRRALPAVDLLLRGLLQAHPELPAWAAKAGARRVLAEARQQLDRGEGIGSEEELMELAAHHARDLARPWPARVVNATGIVLHTNLGRAPLHPEAAAAAAAAGSRYCDLELDLERGERGDRLAAVVEKLELLSGAGGALAVNNNAAALLLALDHFARGGEVIVSRGELVEIGGSFRIPEIVEHAGVRLVEVGTTNRTHAADYERAIGPETRLLLKVHRSNFELRGFVAEVSLAELAAIGQARGLPVFEDLGSGTLVDLSERGLPREAYAPARLGLGADGVCFSGDKLLGGPQAGVVLTRDAALASALRRNPLARALRLDKLSLAALDWTLAAYLDGSAEREIPVLRQLLATPGELELRARRLAERLGKVADDGVRIAVESERAFVGGGSLPGFELPTWVVSLRPPEGAARLAAQLRGAETPVLARIRDGALRIDVRTLLEGDEEVLENAIRVLSS